MAMPRIPLDRDEAIRLYTTGLTYEQIARQLSTKPNVVWRRLHDWGIIGSVPRHGGAWRRDIDAACIVERYIAGASEKALADEHHISRTLIRARLLAAGVSPRTRTEAERLKWSVMKRDRFLVERQCRGAWAASTGRVVPLHTLRAAARMRAQRLSHIGRYEDALRIALRRCGMVAIPQYVVGPYNLDLAIRPARVAVEILTAYINIAKSAAAHRIHYLFDHGWSVLILWCPARQGAPKADTLAQHVITFMEATSRNPAVRRQYGVIRGDGQPVPASRFQRYDGTRVEGF